MNIVKGVADLIRRTSNIQAGESNPRSAADRFPPPTPKICFSDVGEEASLRALWEKYEGAVDKVEKKNLFHVFLEHFVISLKKWRPTDASQFSDAGLTDLWTDSTICGCSFGHPTEVILVLTEEMSQLSALVTESNTSIVNVRMDLSMASTSLSINSEGFLVLEALSMVTRSTHNCRVFGYYGGIQKLTALMKGVVVQLKAITSASSGDESLPSYILEKMEILQQVLLYVVSIFCSFIEVGAELVNKPMLYSTSPESSLASSSLHSVDSTSNSEVSTEARQRWQQKAVVSVMEAGGLNWLVELLRVIRRMSMKGQWMDASVQNLTLRTLLLALSANQRGQNHFKSIGGLEVLLDGLGLPSMPFLKYASALDEKREYTTLKKILLLHVLSLTVLREAVFGNVSNLQFLCEHGRIDKFANSFCSLAFMLQEYKLKLKDLGIQDESQSFILDVKSEGTSKMEPSLSQAFDDISQASDENFSGLWNEYVVKLSGLLCAFIVAPENIQSYQIYLSTVKTSIPMSSVYIELSIRWIIKVLLTVFPCIKACSNGSHLPSHLRVFFSVLQCFVLRTFKHVLISSPALLKVLREEGIWDLIFSENFFYFGHGAEVVYEDVFSHEGGLSSKVSGDSSLSCTEETKSGGVKLEDLQIEVISFVELAATCNGSAGNMPELSALLDALEQSAYHPKTANILAKALLRILQLSSQKTVTSFKALNAIALLLKVASIQAEECRRCEIVSPPLEDEAVISDNQKSDSHDTAQIWRECLETCMGLFREFFALGYETKSLVLHDWTCINRLFDLFWEESLRNQVFEHILDLMKLVPKSEDDQKAKVQLCSRYMETFNQIKERGKCFSELSINLLVGMRELLKTDPSHYQDLFRDGECFLHVVSLLNGNLDEVNGEKLVLNVLQTLTCLLAGNDVSKAAFRALVGRGYQTMHGLLLDFFQKNPNEALLDTLLDMLVECNFKETASPLIKNEDVIILYLSVLQKSSESLRMYGLNTFQHLLKDSISNRASCVRAGMLGFLLDWFSLEDNDGVIMNIAQLIQFIGGHSISGKDIRKIFALLRSEKVGSRQEYCSILLTTVLSMLNEKGPTAFFDCRGDDSGVMIRTPLQWPLNKGFSFACWLRVENFPRTGLLSLFSFLNENGKGCLAALGKDRLVYESIHLKRQAIQLHLNIVRKKWHFLSITHSIGRAFSGGSLVRCYLDGDLVSSERCRYAKVGELLTNCSIGMKIQLSQCEEDSSVDVIHEYSSFNGQIGPVYLFSDAISSEQVHGIYLLGPSYMYSFLENEVVPCYDNHSLGGILDAKDGLASKVVFGLNAQASAGRKLFNVSQVLDHEMDRKSFEATVIVGTQLCSRRLLRDIIYCVGGVSVFFPLIAQSDRYENEDTGTSDQTLLTPIMKERLTAEVIELIASVLDDNISNQQQMHLISGFSVLGFLLRSVPPHQLNLEMLSALKHLFHVAANSGLSELLVKDAISSIFLNPFIWVYTEYMVQRELYMFLIQQFDNDPRLLKTLCCLPRVIDIICHFYWDNAKSQFAVGSKPLLHPITKQIIGERPSKEEVNKIRLLFLSLGEMSLRQSITAEDIKALIAFFETTQDVACIEDILHMVIRALSQKQLLVSFLEQVNIVGGVYIFVNLLQREYEPIRLLSLQFLGKLLFGLPSEKKGARFFHLPVGRSRSISEDQKKITSRMQLIFSAISDRLFRFSLTDNLCATLFDVLLGGASPKQVLQKHVDKNRTKGNSSHFCLPQMLVLIFRFLSSCVDVSARIEIIRDLLDLLDSNSSNIEELMEHGWNAWLTACLELRVLKVYKVESGNLSDGEMVEQNLVRSLFCTVLCHYIVSVKGGWLQLEETVNFFLLHREQGDLSYRYLLRDIFEDLVRRLLEFSSQENIFVSQPCRDNTLFLLRLLDEILISEIDKKILFPAIDIEIPPDSSEVQSQKDFSSALYEIVQAETGEDLLRNPWNCKHPITYDEDEDINNDKWWSLFDNVWILISEMNDKGPSKTVPKLSPAGGPSLGQRARGLVESLNIPAAEMAAVVVSGGIGNALGTKPSKTVDKAMLLRGERCPRIFFRLVVLYLCKSSLERASRCVQQVITLLPPLLIADDEQSKSKLQLLIWVLLTVKSGYGGLDDGVRFHVIAHLVRQTVNYGKSVLANSIIGKEDSADSGTSSKDTVSLQHLIQKDRVIAAVSDEAKYVRTTISDRLRQINELKVRRTENFSIETANKKAFEDELHNNLSIILASDEGRRTSFQLNYEEEQQYVAAKWIHMFRLLIDERGPWSADPFPNCAVRHWKLDKTEDSWRRRPKLKQNYHFDERLCNPPSSAHRNEDNLSVNENKSSIDNLIPEQMKRFLLKGAWMIMDEGNPEAGESEAEPSVQKASIPEDPLDTQCLELVRSSSEQNVVQDQKDSSPSSDIGTSEVLKSISCVLLTPKRKLAGKLAVMKGVLHFFGEFLVEGTGGSSIFRSFPASTHSDSGLQNEKDVASDNTNHRQLKHIKRHRRWKIGKIKAVHWTRYLLRYTAIEIFFTDSVAPVFLNFASKKDAKDVGTLIVATRNELLFPKGSSKDKSGTITFVDRHVALQMAESARDSWRRRDITNFEYLMILNTLAGRSYNDLTQYPVFPWVLADYSSEVLDFNKSATFRDLTKPVGALDAKRFEVFEDRYRNFADPDIPSFYYGSHYSSMGIVLYYLLRLEPFTFLHRNLQGGKFDHADRLFQSIEATYRNCLSNTSDVKELIPEFFYMPEFLVNSNSYHFGVKQDGEPLGDVVLPPWAKGSPELFISKNREALESEYVSSNLHHWIDLVFGYMQRGKPAVEAANIFYYLTYEGAVDLDTMEDELQRSAIEDQIANFGQTPIQIFRKKHPRRGPPVPIAHPLSFAPDSINLTSIVPTTSSSPSAVLYVDVLDSNIVLVNQGLTLSVKMWLSTQLQSGGNFTFSGFQEPLFGIGSDVLSTRKIASPLAENIEPVSQFFGTMQTHTENFLLSCGNWENSFQVISLNDGRMVQSIRQHKDVVSCLAVSADGSIIATGSHDTTVMVWEVIRTRASEKRVRNAQIEFPRKDYVVSETPFHILCGHDDIVTCLFVSVELDIVISGSKDGTCIFHSLREGRYLRSIRHPIGCALSKLVASHHGRIVFYADDDLSLHLYSINGKHLATSESNGRLNCLELSRCGEFLVSAGDQGQIIVRSMNTLDVLKKYTGVGKIITCLRVTAEECFLAGTKDGILLLYSIENPHLRKSGPRNFKTRPLVAG